MTEPLTPASANRAEVRASKRPAFQFYPSDWRTDPGLRLCSIPARGLWIEMLCLMHEGEPYGHLTRQGNPLTSVALARLCGEAVGDIEQWLAELRDNGVYSLSDAGAIVSRRMVRDEQIRSTRAAGGELGKEHGQKGARHGKKGGRPRKQKTPVAETVRGVSAETARGVSEPPPSSSSSSSSVEEPSQEREPLRVVTHVGMHARDGSTIGVRS